MMHDCPLQPGRFFARWLLSLSCGTLHTLNLEVQSERWSIFECRQFVCTLARGDSYEVCLAGLQESSQRVAMCCWRWYATGRLTCADAWHCLPHLRGRSCRTCCTGRRLSRLTCRANAQSTCLTSTRILQKERHACCHKLLLY